MSLRVTCYQLFCSQDEGGIDDQFYRERLMTRWKRECREVDDALLDVENESSELGEILDDPNKSAMKKAKMEVSFINIENNLQISSCD